jgi:hypothetical protein
MPRPSHPDWFDHPDIWNTAHLIEIIFILFFQSPWLLTFRYKYFSQHIIKRILYSLLFMRVQVPHPYFKKVKIMALHKRGKNPKSLVARINKFCTMAPNIFNKITEGFISYTQKFVSVHTHRTESVRYIIWRWLPDFLEKNLLAPCVPHFNPHVSRKETKIQRK